MTLDEGAELADGLSVLEHLRSSRRYDVYLAWDERRYALVVAKVLRPDRLDNARSQQRLRDESEPLARLAHPGVVRSFGAVLEGSQPHVVLEYVDAENVREVVQAQGSLPTEQVVPVGVHVASALHYLAGQDVVHLDVKPSNVLLATPPRLIDFGGARAVAATRSLRRPVGTDPYMAPEVTELPESAERITPAADVWSLGATLYYGLAGRPPFWREDGAKQSEDPRVRFPQRFVEPDELGVRVPRELEALLRAMLARDPAARPTAAEAADTLSAL